jgi:predicted nucleic acid-binding protein
MIFMTNKILCDSDFVISLLCEEESTYTQALLQYNTYFDNGAEFWIMNITLYEVATVLSRKFDQPRAIQTLELVEENFKNIIRISEADESEAFELYKSFAKKNISFFDCACQTVATNNKMKIASFDKFYDPKILA